jgi:hypothetical protein
MACRAEKGKQVKVYIISLGFDSLAITRELIDDETNSYRSGVKCSRGVIEAISVDSFDSAMHMIFYRLRDLNSVIELRMNAGKS